MNERLLQDDRLKVFQASAKVIKLPSSSAKHSLGVPDIEIFEPALDDGSRSKHRAN